MNRYEEKKLGLACLLQEAESGIADQKQVLNYLRELEKAWAALEFIAACSTYLPSTTDHSEQEEHIAMIKRAREALND